MRRFLVLVPLLACFGCNDKVAASKSDPAKSDYEEIMAITVPAMQDGGDLVAYSDEMRTAWKKREPLVLAYFEKYPEDFRTAELMNEYWQSLMRNDLEDEEADRIIAAILKAESASHSEQLKKHAAFWSTFYVTYRNRKDIEKSIELAIQYTDKYPSDPRGAVLFNFVTLSEFASEDQVKRAFASLSTRYPSSQEGTFSKYMLGLMGYLHKPFNFSFEDEVTGRTITDESLRGKVIVVDFWATWCAPCIEAMPRMKEIYKTFKDRGVEFVGVSLDQPEAQGGRKALLDYVKANQIPWPQYYLGGDRTFALDYGVGQIPTVFVVDRQGRIHSVDGYRVLERTLQEMVGS